MDLIDEQDVALVEVGQDGGQVTRPLQRRPAGDPEPHLHLGRHDPGQGCFSEARRAGEEKVVGGLAPLAGGAEDDLEVLPQRRLADELGQAAGPQRGLLLLVLRVGRHPGPEQLLTHEPLRCR